MWCSPNRAFPVFKGDAAGLFSITFLLSCPCLSPQGPLQEKLPGVQPFKFPS